MEFIGVKEYFKEKEKNTVSSKRLLSSLTKEEYFILLNLKIEIKNFFTEYKDKYFPVIDGRFILFLQKKEGYGIYYLTKKSFLLDNIFDKEEDINKFLCELCLYSNRVWSIVNFNTISECNDFYDNLININMKFRISDVFKCFDTKGNLIYLDDSKYGYNNVKKIH